MVKEGSIQSGYSLGYKNRRKYVYRACLDCGHLRWVPLCNPTPRCRVCACKKIDNKMHNHPCWNGGKYVSPDGYNHIYLDSQNPFYSMANVRGYVLEHRLIMAKHLGRCLLPREVIHHKNGKRDDNRLENLELVDNAGEHIINHSKGYRDGFEKGYQDGLSLAKQTNVCTL